MYLVVVLGGEVLFRVMALTPGVSDELTLVNVCVCVCLSLSVPRLAVVKEMVRRLQELRHTEQVQRAYALNCGEGATVSYELQLRVLREFGLPDAAAELLQVRAFPSCTPSPSTLLWRHTANTTPSDTPLCPCDRR